MAGDGGAAIFDARVAFQEAFRQNAKLGDDAKGEAENDQVQVRNLGESFAAKEPGSLGAEDGSNQAADAPFDGFAGADAGDEFSAAEFLANDKGKAVRHPDDGEGKQEPGAGLIVFQEERGKGGEGKSNVGEGEDRRGNVHPGAFNFSFQPHQPGQADANAKDVNGVLQAGEDAFGDEGQNPPARNAFVNADAFFLLNPGNLKDANDGGDRQ